MEQLIKLDLNILDKELERLHKLLLSSDESDVIFARQQIKELHGVFFPIYYIPHNPGDKIL